MKWKIPPDPRHGLELVHVFLKFVDDAKPKFWVLENVANLAKYLEMKPEIMNAKIWGGKHHVFYGNFPPFLMPYQERNIMHMDVRGGKLRPWLRAKIPLTCSRAFAHACKEALLE